MARVDYGDVNKLALWRRRQASFMTAQPTDCFMAREGELARGGYSVGLLALYGGAPAVLYGVELRSLWRAL